MSHSEFGKATFASAHEWRRLRALTAAATRHGHDDIAQECRAALPLFKAIGGLRAAVCAAPGMFELGTERAESLYMAADDFINAFCQAPS